MVARRAEGRGPARGEERRSSLRVGAGWTSAAALAAFVACTGEEALQGEGYAPDGELATAPPTDRVLDAGGCVLPDGASCDGGDAAVTSVPAGDASNAPTNTCETARDVGTVSGDTLSPSLSAQGTCSEYLSLRATENDDGVFGAPMKLKVTLTSPPNDDVDLYAFVNPAKDVPACASPFAVSEIVGLGISESLSLRWGEGRLANGADDGRTVGLLVFHPRTPCLSGATWRVVVDGNL